MINRSVARDEKLAGLATKECVEMRVSIVVGAMSLILLGPFVSCYRPESKTAVRSPARSNSAIGEFSFLGSAAEIRASVERARTEGIGNLTAEELIATVKAGKTVPAKEIAQKVSVDLEALDALLPPSSFESGDVLALEPCGLALRVKPSGEAIVEVMSDQPYVAKVAYDTFNDQHIEYMYVDGKSFAPMQGTLGSLAITIPATNDRLSLSIAGSSVAPEARIVCRREANGDRVFFVGPSGS